MLVSVPNASRHQKSHAAIPSVTAKTSASTDLLSASFFRILSSTSSSSEFAAIRTLYRTALRPTDILRGPIKDIVKWDPESKRPPGRSI